MSCAMPIDAAGLSDYWFDTLPQSETMIARQLAFDEAGRERLLGEYTFNLTRTLPRPGAW
jgi:hypothetical protein